MAREAVYVDYISGNHYGAQLYGVEYQTSGYGLYGDYRSVHDGEVPCAVCENNNARSTFTLFGNVTCPSGYSSDYTGYVFADYYTSYNHRNQYICVDDSPVIYDNNRGQSNDDQGFIYPAEFEACSPFDCPPWVQNREVTCTQCSAVDLSVAARPVDCVVGNWTDWDECSKACGGGTKNRTREIVTAAENGGKACPSLMDQVICNAEACSNITQSNTTYIRFGRYTCNSPSKVVFQGYTAG